jgi:hypothetical protein
MIILKIYRSWKDKDNKPLKTSDGREYERVAIQTKEYGSKWISGFGGNWNRNWKEGDNIDIEIEEKGQYLNFKRPDPLKALEERVARIEAELWAKRPQIDEEDVNIASDEITDEQIPF